MNRLILILILGLFLVPTAQAACWKLRNGDVIETSSGSTPPQAGAKRTSCRNLPSNSPPELPVYKVWVGAPGNSTWPPACSGSSKRNCGLPSNHWTLSGYGSDWSVDLAASEGSSVRFYAAPDDKKLKMRAKVGKVSRVCKSPSMDGGDLVQVDIELSADGKSYKKVGEVVYAHLVVSDKIKRGTELKYGATLGKVFGGADASDCWEGSHVHLELDSTYSGKACWNKGWRPGQSVGKSNFVGFVGETGFRSPASCN